jgi:FKBP-type peptidyl-prolyl cis-trans isomerase FklB
MKLTSITLIVALSAMSVVAFADPNAAVNASTTPTTTPASPMNHMNPPVPTSTTPVAANAPVGQYNETAVQQTTTPTSAPANVLKTETDRLSYSLGVEMGYQLKNQSVDINPDLLAQGIKDAQRGGQLLMATSEMKQTIIGFQQRLFAKRKNMADKNAQDGQQFMVMNAKQPNVRTLASGLQYRVITQGSGVSPTDKDIVTVNYEGRLINGKVFDSSYQRGMPATFALSEVIPGWQEALRLMRAGDTWEVVIPPRLAYGEHGMGNTIGPNETLIFKINLIAVQKRG